MEEDERKEWLDDAHDFSSPETDYVFVEVRSRSKSGDVIHMTDFRLTPAQARAMFYGIAGTE